MAKKNDGGFFDGLVDDICRDLELRALIEATRDENGKVDKWAATGAAFGFGHTSAEDIVMLGAMLGAEGAFDPDIDSTNDFDDFESSDIFNDTPPTQKYEWREFAEDGFDVGLDPDDYETEEEYEDALEEARHAWRELAEDGFDVGLDPDDYETEEEYDEALATAREEDASSNIPISASIEPTEEDTEIKESDYPNKRRYNAAVTLANQYLIYFDKKYERLEKERCQFILEQGDTVTAANYLTENGEFLFAQAVKDNFELPITLPDEDEESKFEFSDVIKKIARKNVTLALDVWAWCIKEFLPYAKYMAFARSAMTDYLIDELCDFTEKFKGAFLQYLSEHPDFRKTLIREAENIPSTLGDLIIETIKNKLTDTAKAMFEDGLYKADGNWKAVNKLMGDLILFAKDYEELETIEFVELNFLPKMKSYSDGMILDEIEGWKKDIEEYKANVEKNSEKYAYARGNAWRKNVPDGSEYGLDPCDYDSEQEYLDAIQEEKYSWRKWCLCQDTLGLDVNEFETEEEYREAWEKCRQEQLDRKRQETQEQRMDENKKRIDELASDKTIYTYCGVKLPFSDRPYSFRTDDDTIKIGDSVIVPIGEDNKEKEGTVVSVGQYARMGVPYPPEKTKFIIKKLIETNRRIKNSGQT